MCKELIILKLYNVNRCDNVTLLYKVYALKLTDQLINVFVEMGIIEKSNIFITPNKTEFLQTLSVYKLVGRFI